MQGLVAGSSVVPLPAKLGTPMMGYGARKGTAEAQHDPLVARALYLRGAGECLIVECDLCLVAPAQARAVRECIAARAGISSDCILLGCIHTHSAPDTGFAQLLAGQEVPAHVAPLLDAAVRAGEEAVSQAAPARLGVGRAEAYIGRNRRSADGPLDSGVLVVRVDSASQGPLAVLYVHGCHPTALGHDNLSFSADWPGAAGRAIVDALPGVNPIFALGAHADVDPRTRGLLDLAIPNQSVGVSFDETVALGRELGEAVATAAAAIETRPDATVGARSSSIPIPALQESEGERADALEALGLPQDSSAGTAELFALEHERTRDLPIEERREHIARVRLYLRNRTARRFAFGECPQVEVQVLRIGHAHLVGLPAEPTVDVGFDWKSRTGEEFAAVIGIANGWLRYLPHPRNFEEPLAHHKYEILLATLVPDAARRLLDEAEHLDAMLSQELGA